MGNFFQGNEIKNINEEKEEEIKTLNKIKEIKENALYGYYCKECGEKPLLNFSLYDFNICCLNHKILNIPIEDFYNFIIFDYKCSICKQFFQPNNSLYCYECKNFYCNNCIKEHNKKVNIFHHIINSYEKDIICFLHNKKFNRFCLKCKVNLCELCKNHNRHYVEEFNYIYPLDEDLEICYNTISTNISIIKEVEEKLKQNIYYTDELKKYYKKKKLCNEIKYLLAKSFNKSITNYNYLCNIKNIINNTLIEEFDNMHMSFNMKDSNIEYINTINSKDDRNNIENKIIFKSKLKENKRDGSYCIWSMKKLNDIKINSQQNLELIAIGGTDNKIFLLNCVNFKYYQIIEEHTDTVNSLEQYKNEPNFLYSSSKDWTINIYKLDNNYKYKLIQKLRKTQTINEFGINKVIILSNKLLVTSDKRSITIWKNISQDENKINYVVFYEIIINLNTSNLLEINESIFVATQYNHLQVYKNDENSFPLIGQLEKIKSQGNSSNTLSKINDNMICLGSNNSFYIISISPLQVIQKIIIYSSSIYFIYTTKENFIYCKGNNNILQYKIITDKNNNFIELTEIGKYNYNFQNRAILAFDDGRVFFAEQDGCFTYYQLMA